MAILKILAFSSTKKMQRALVVLAMAASAAAFAPASAPLSLRSSRAAAAVRPASAGLTMKTGDKFEMAPGVGLPLGQSGVTNHLFPAPQRAAPQRANVWHAEDVQKRCTLRVVGVPGMGSDQNFRRGDAF